MKTLQRLQRAATPVALPGKLFAHIAQEAAAIGNRDLAIEFINMAYLAFSAEIEQSSPILDPGQLELTLVQQDG